MQTHFDVTNPATAPTTRGARSAWWRTGVLASCVALGVAMAAPTMARAQGGHEGGGFVQNDQNGTGTFSDPPATDPVSAPADPNAPTDPNGGEAADANSGMRRMP